VPHKVSDIASGPPTPIDLFNGFYFLDVHGTTKGGIQLSDYFYVFFVNSAASG
jgi:hypothetical protein